MLKIKDDFDLMQLQNYGFYIYINKYENNKDYIEIYKIENISYGLKIDPVTRYIDSIHKTLSNTASDYTYRRAYLDIIYKMINDNIIEISEDKISKKLFKNDEELDDSADYDYEDYYSDRILFKAITNHRYDSNIEYVNIYNVKEDTKETCTEFEGSFDKCIEFITQDDNRRMYSYENFKIEIDHEYDYDILNIYLFNYSKSDDYDDFDYILSENDNDNKSPYIKVTYIKED